MTNALLILNNEWTSGQLFQMRGCLHPSLLFLQPVLICPNSWWDDLQYKLRIGFGSQVCFQIGKQPDHIRNRRESQGTLRCWESDPVGGCPQPLAVPQLGLWLCMFLFLVLWFYQLPKRDSPRDWVCGIINDSDREVSSIKRGRVLWYWEGWGKLQG